MPTPGIYLINSTGETVALATEDGDGDRSLLHEALDELGIQHPSHVCDVCNETYNEWQPSCPECGLGSLRKVDDR